MSTLDVLDISPLFAGAPAPDLDGEIARRFSTDAAVVVSRFPGSAGLEDRVARLRAFFAQPEPVRMALATRAQVPDNPNLYRGYTPPPVGKGWAYNEKFDVGPEPPLPAPDLPSHAAFTEPNVWPNEAEAPGWRADMLGYIADCKALSAVVIRSAARGLGVDSAGFDAICESANSTLRLLHYPPVPDDFELFDAENPDLEPTADGKRVITRPHVDTGGLTILWQDDSGGLQMQGRDGDWRVVPTGDGVLSIHCGDMLAGIGGEALAPTPHRVLGGEGDRFSIGYFIEPEFMTEVTPPDGGAPKTYGQHLTDQFPKRFLPPELQ